MDWQGKVIRVCGAALVFALLLRLSSTGFFQPVMQVLTSRQAASVIFFLETGRVLRQAEPQPDAPATSATEPEATAPPQPTTVQTTPTQPVLPQDDAGAVAVFSPEDAALVQVNSYCGYGSDVPGWLSRPLSWELKQDAPTVLIVHSHGSESYENTEGYTEAAAYRTLDENYNVISIGDALVQHLETRGIRALHDRQLHDQPSYSDSYGNSRSAIREYLQAHPSIRLVLDIHRDAVADEAGQQVKYTTQTPQGQVAQLMLVVGTDAGGLSHAKWPENMSLAVKLHAQLEKLCPGICRPISFRAQRFNQDLSTGAVLVEVGAAGNTRQEALAATGYLAEAILALSAGSQSPGG